MVFFAITNLGLDISTLGSLAVLRNKASLEILIPGVIAPPKYSPSFEIAQKVMAVPKSTIIKGPPYFRSQLLHSQFYLHPLLLDYHILYSSQS